MAAHYQHNGWNVSPYSQKTLAYIKFKKIAHQDVAPNFYTLLRTIQKKVGKAIMPTVITPEGEWWQDSSEIISNFEKRYPDNGITPEGVKQQITSHLFELIGDEWLIMPALQYRWTIKQNSEFAINEFATYGAPFLPKFLAKLVGIRVSQMMQAYMPRFGIVGETQQGVINFTEGLIAYLDKHFAEHDYLLGSKPCLGDFAIYGSLYAHLYRDPGSRYLFDQAPNVVRWIKVMLDPDFDKSTGKGRDGEFLADDRVPETLNPILEHFFAEQFVFVKGVIEAVNQYVEKNPAAKRPSRIVGMTDFVIGGVEGNRAQFAFTQYKAQGALNIYHELSVDQKVNVDAWLSQVGGEAFKATELKHKLKREHFKEVFDR